MNDGFRTVSRYELDYLLRRDDSSIMGYSVGAPSRLENTALDGGVVVAGGDSLDRSTMSVAEPITVFYWRMFTPAILTLVVRYSVHSMHDLD